MSIGKRAWVALVVPERCPSTTRELVDHPLVREETKITVQGAIIVVAPQASF